jgi:putative DNA primase/helicase
MQEKKPEASGKVEQHAPGAAQPAEFTEDAIALRFAERHASDLRYVAKWGKWFRWTGSRWEDEETRYVFDLARALCREENARCNKPAKTLAAAKTRAAVVSMSGDDRRIAAIIDQWDKDLWLLNTPGGVVDLRTGTMRPHRPEDYMTKITAVAPDGDCPLFLKFLETITAGDKELQTYLQRVFGYALTGSVKEHALFFCYGIGSNGKSTLMNTVAGIMGDYYSAASVETFTVTMGDRHPADLAALRGARLVIASETEEGRHWAESRIKQLTGGDPISARFMRQDWFTYFPQFKLLFLGNHKPGLRAVNVAIRRRLNLIPFEVVIPEAQRDKDLADKLRKEWPGILAWMIQGCLAWQREGLAAPASVTAATDRYLEAEDALGAWIEDCCERNPNSHTSTHELYESWKVWAIRSGYHERNEKWLTGKLDDAGFRAERVWFPKLKRKVRGYWGLQVARQAPPPPPELPF